MARVTNFLSPAPSLPGVGRPLSLRPALAAAWLSLLIGLVFFEPVAWLVREWQDNPYYGHGPLVPLVSVIVAAVALPRLLAGTQSTSRWGVSFFLVALGLRVVGALGGSDFLGALAILPLLGGLAGWWFGARGLRALAFPILFLFFAIPLPFMDDVGFYFQRLSTISTTALVRPFGIPATYQGAEISLPAASFSASSFFVGVQCSGLYSTMTLFALGLVFTRVMGLRGWWRPGVLTVAALPIAIVTNDFRLGSLLGIAYHRSAEVAMAYYHNFGDVVFWLMALMLFFALGKGLEWTQARAGSSSPASCS